MKRYVMGFVIASIVFTGGCTAKNEVVEVEGTPVTVIDDSKQEKINFNNVNKIENINIIAWLNEDEAVVAIPTDIETFEYDMGKDEFWKIIKWNYKTDERSDYGPADLYVYPVLFAFPSVDSSYLFVDGVILGKETKSRERVFLVLDKDGEIARELPTRLDDGLISDFHWTDGSTLGYIRNDTTLEYIDMNNPDGTVFSKKLVKGRDECSSDDEYYETVLRNAIKIEDKILYSTNTKGSYMLDDVTGEEKKISDFALFDMNRIGKDRVIFTEVNLEKKETTLKILNFTTMEENSIMKSGLIAVLGVCSDKRYVVYETYGNNGGPGAKLYDIETGNEVNLPFESCSIAMNSDLSLISGSKLDLESDMMKYITIILGRDN